MASVNGGPCPEGHYCPGDVSSTGFGTADPLPCVAGMYSGTIGLSECVSCPAGKQCGPTTIIPADCSTGHFCPNGTGVSPSSCPIGSFSASTDLFNVDQCTPCSGGHYCPTTAMSAVGPECSAGQYCTIGCGDDACTLGLASKDGGECPAGYYCLQASTMPVLCPTGSASLLAGLERVEDCQSCSPGFYCDGSSPGSAITGPCDEGWYCSGGTTIARPTVNGDICPVGNVCVEGSSSPQQCLPGTYAPSTGMVNCTACPAGRLCDAPQMSVPSNCPTGHYCTASSSVAEPCPAGTFNPNVNADVIEDCQYCDSGFYCQSTGNSAVTGPCSAGWFCPNGSAVAEPVGSFPDNGPCPAGYYCPSGATMPIECPVGTYRPSEGGSSLASCLNCQPGYYCAGTALTTPTALCAAGVYCDDNTKAVHEYTGNHLCPAGYYCPEGSPYPVGCEDGKYQLSEGSDSCDLCPPGTFCLGNATVPAECPLGHFCVEGTGNPVLCPAGRIGSTPGLQSADECAECPSTKYCLGGVEAGNCAAGYICYSGADDPRPDGVNGTSSAPSQNGPCPIGHWCSEACLVPTACALGTVRAVPGAAMASDCGPCPAGYICLDGDPTPIPCPSGYYCPADEPQMACPRTTYFPSTAAGGKEDCLPCPPGTLCIDEATSNLDQYPCPIGGYCLEAANFSIPCPAGRYSAIQGAGSPADCPLCLPGHYCEENTMTPTPCPQKYYCPEGVDSITLCPARKYCPEMTADPIACPDSYYCPSGVSVPIICPTGSECNNEASFAVPCNPGYLCPSGTSLQTPCEAGFYCPNDSDLPLECPSGYYCPAASQSPLICPLGFGPLYPSTALGRSSIDTACVVCGPGTYQAGGASERVDCLPCPAGFVCLGETPTATPVSLVDDKGFRCPPGYYCPEGSYETIACPAGTFNSEYEMSNITECLPCPAMSYSPVTASPSCLPCGASASSEEGRATCECFGSNRSFQQSDGKCLCKPGYAYFLASGVESSESGPQNCIKKTYDRCDSRDPDGECDNDESHCAAVCAGRDPTTGELLIPNAGQKISNIPACECSDVTDPDEICDANCRGSQAVLTVEASNDGSLNIVVKVPRTNTKLEQDASSTENWSAAWAVDLKPGQNLSVLHTSFAGGVVRGILDPHPSYLTSLFTTTAARRAESAWFENSTLSTDLGSGDGVSGGIIRPTMVLLTGEAVSFAVTAEHYPEYIPEALLNTNEDFDYGDFRRLANVQSNPLLELSSFTFQFTESGTYVFGDAAELDQRLIVIVLEEEEEVPESLLARVLPTTSTVLTAAGVTPRMNLTLKTDWFLMMMIFGALTALFFILAFILFFIRWRASATGPPPYKRVGEQFVPVFGRVPASSNRQKAQQTIVALRKPETDYEARPALTRVKAETSLHGFASKEVVHTVGDGTVEDFSAKLFYDKLEDQTIHVSTQLSRTKAEAASFYRYVDVIIF